MSYLMDFKQSSTLCTALNNASDFVREKYNIDPQCTSMDIMEKEFNIVFHHYLREADYPLLSNVEFIDEPNALFFILKWA